MIEASIAGKNTSMQVPVRFALDSIIPLDSLTMRCTVASPGRALSGFLV